MQPNIKQMLQAKAEEEFKPPLHPEMEYPATALKHYQRKAFYEGGKFMYNEIITNPSKYLAGLRWVSCDEHLPGYAKVLASVSSNIVIRNKKTKSVIEEYFSLYGEKWGLQNYEWLDESISETSPSDELEKGDVLNHTLMMYDLEIRKGEEKDKEIERLKNLIKDLHGSGVEAALMLAGYNKIHAKELQQEAYRQYCENNNL
jgi:hypothetical protein